MAAIQTPDYKILIEMLTKAVHQAKLAPEKPNDPKIDRWQGNESMVVKDLLKQIYENAFGKGTADEWFK